MNAQSPAQACYPSGRKHGRSWAAKRREFITLLAARNSGGANCYCFRSFGFEFQGPCSAFTSWRARKRDPKTFSLAAHNQELVLGHVTFVLQQLFQISLERGL